MSTVYGLTNSVHIGHIAVVYMKTNQTLIIYLRVKKYRVCQRHIRGKNKKDDFFVIFFSIQYIFFNTGVIGLPSDYTVSEDPGIEPRTVATLALAVRRSNHSARSHMCLPVYFVEYPAEYSTFL
jgi:hypothetical protein